MQLRGLLVPFAVLGCFGTVAAQAQSSIRVLAGPLAGDGFEEMSTAGSGTTTTTTETEFEGDLGLLLSFHRQGGRRVDFLVETLGGRLDASQTKESRTPAGPAERTLFEKELDLVLVQVGGAFYPVRQETYNLYGLLTIGVSFFDRLLSESPGPALAWSAGVGADRRFGRSGWWGSLQARYIGTRYSTEVLSFDGDLLFIGGGLAYRFDGTKEPRRAP